MPCEFQTLLPANRSKLEVAIEQEQAGKYCRIHPEILAQIHNPLTCPVELLPWLAYAASVDVYNEAWAEHTKRAVIANAFAAHRQKGLHGSIETALSALGVSVEVIEWWQAKPPAEVGTMEVIVHVDQQIIPDAEVVLGIEVIHDLLRQLERNKRASIHYTFTTRLNAETGMAIAYSAGEFTQLTRAAMRNTEVSITPQAMGIQVAHSAELEQFTQVEMQNTEAQITPQTVGMQLAHSCEFTQITYMEMTV